MRRPAALLLAVVLVVALAGCSGTMPFETAPPPLLPGQDNPGKRVAICYNTFKTTPDKLREMAQAQCLGDGVAEPIDTDYRLENCPLLTPGRATFLCKPAK